MAPTNERGEAGPGNKCCMGVSYFNRAMEQRGQSPRCVGLGQIKHGDQGSDDVRELPNTTGAFEYYCVGYSSHPSDYLPSKSGRPVNMPYCEGVEAIMMEDRAPATAPVSAGAVSPIPALGAGSSQLLRDRTPTLDHGAAPSSSHPATEGPSDEDRSLQARFRKNFMRNAENLRGAVTGARPLPQLPVQMRTFDSVKEASSALAETASVNILKMRVMADFIAHRTMQSVVRPIWERFSEEETE